MIKPTPYKSMHTVQPTDSQPLPTPTKSIPSKKIKKSAADQPTSSVAIPFNPAGKDSPICGGLRISGRTQFGTLGVIVSDADGKLWGITAHHVVDSIAPENKYLGTPTMQVAGHKLQYARGIGQTGRLYGSWDEAVQTRIEQSDMRHHLRDIAIVGFPETNHEDIYPMALYSRLSKIVPWELRKVCELSTNICLYHDVEQDMRVYKRGAGTGITSSRIEHSCSAAHGRGSVGFSTAKGQWSTGNGQLIQCGPKFLDKGDSGAAVYDGDNRLLGIAVMGSRAGKESSYVVPIEAILIIFGLTLPAKDGPLVM